MSQIEKLYREWSEEQINSEELTAIYRRIEKELRGKLSFRKFNEIDELIMDCVIAERIEAFKGGFQQATAIWKECC